MPDIMLERLQVEGLTSISAASVEFRRLNMLIGANGAGKSNLVRALELLGQVVDENLQSYVEPRGAVNLLRVGARQILLSLRGRVGELGTGYAALLSPSLNENLIIDERIIHAPAGGLPATYLAGAGVRETKLHDIAARPGDDQERAAAIVAMLRGCRVYHFHDTSQHAAVKRPAPTADNLTLRPDAANLAALLRQMRGGGGAGAVAYRRIVLSIRLVAPFFRDFLLEPEEGQDLIRLRWRESGTDAVFSAHQMSDGTLRFACLATLLLQPTLPALVVLDEPELGLHPYAIVQLAGLLRSASVRSQVVVATQSVTLMNQFELEDLIVVERDRGSGGTHFVRPDPGALEMWLEDYSLGELWEKNLLGGRPGSVPGLASE